MKRDFVKALIEWAKILLLDSGLCATLNRRRGDANTGGNMKRAAICLVVACALSGCASTSLNTALGTPKNPTAIYSDPYGNVRNNEDLFIQARFGVLAEALNLSTKPITMNNVTPTTDMRRYLATGYSLADTYCKRYFHKTDEAYRRRQFGRTLTNDVGTASTTLLGLVNAGESAVTALAAVTGLADSAWRNYDDSFIISPDLAAVRSLVKAAQDNYRARTLGEDAKMPTEYGTALSTIEAYSEICSHLNMRALLTQSANEQKTLLNNNTDALNKPKPTGTGTATTATTTTTTAPGQPSPLVRPDTATPALAPNVAKDK